MPYVPEALTIENYPWPDIDARELLRRVEEAENPHHEDCDTRGLGPDLEPSTKPCNCYVLWRERAEESESRIVELNTQLEAWPDQVMKALGAEQRNGVEALEECADSRLAIASFGEIRNELHDVLVDAGIEPAADVEAVKGRDLVGRVKRLVVARERATDHEGANKIEGSAARALTKLAGYLSTPYDVEIDPDDEAYAWSPSFRILAEYLKEHFATHPAPQGGPGQ